MKEVAPISQPNTVLSKETFSLPLKFVGEQAVGKTNIPFDSFTTVSDKDFLDQIEKDARTDKIIYAYTDSGKSENSREWSGDNMKSMASQVLTKMPVGYLGHIKPKDYGYVFPEPQIVWYGSTTEDLPDDVVRLWIKGYLLPTADKLETWIKSKAVDSISVYGMISYEMEGENIIIKDVNLKSIDVSRKLGEGLNSGVVGLYGEMNATYEEISSKLQIAMKEYTRENYEAMGFKKPKNKNESFPEPPYCWCYIRKMYTGKKEVVMNVEIYGETKMFNIEYSVDESKDNNPVTITSYSEVIEKTTFEDKPNGASNDDISVVAEMKDKKEELNMGTQNTTGTPIATPAPAITLDAVKSDKTLMDQLKKEFATEMESQSKQKVLVAAAGEMEEVQKIIGGEQSNIAERVRTIASFNTQFVGEMAAIFGEQEMDPEAIIEATKETVQTVNDIKEAVGAKDDDDVVAAVKDVAAAAADIEINEAISEVDAAFDAKVADIDNEALVEFIRDDFSDIVGLEKEDIEDENISEWKKYALEEIESKFDGVLKKIESRLEKISKGARAAGEMSAVVDLGVAASAGTSTGNKADEDPDVAEIRKLGYNVE